MTRIYGFVLILIIVIATSNPALADKEWKMVKMPLDNILKIQDIFFLDSTTAWALDWFQTPNGSANIIYTTDAGRTWIKKLTLPNVLFDIFFVDNQNGWISGDGLILHTEDGGKNWSKHDAPGRIGYICFIDAKRGWCIDNLSGKVLHTEDGGETWQVQYQTQPDIPISGIYFINALVGWVLGWSDGFVLHTTDGGNTWERQECKISGPNPLWGIYFVSENIGWVSGWNGIIFHTEDGGRTWIKQESNTNAGLQHIYAIDSSEAWVGGAVYVGDSSSPLLLHTKDGGKTWHKVDGDFLGGYIVNIHFFDANEGYVATFNGGIYHTNDGGQTWEMVHAYCNTLLGMIYPGLVYFVNEKSGWLIGSWNFIFHTSDGGRTWEFQKDDADCLLRDVCFIDDKEGWIVGVNMPPVHSGIIYHTKDGGKTWSKDIVPVGVPGYTDVKFFNSMEGCVIGPEIFHTDNGGKKWEIVTPKELTGTGAWLDLEFIDSRHGWAVHNLGEVAYTDDGGVSWEVIDRTTKFFEKVDFVNQWIGWGIGEHAILEGETVVGLEGFVFYTEDGGRSWTNILKLDSLLDAICFVSLTEGWIAGEGIDGSGFILHTTDGGKTWKEQYRAENIRARIYSICYDGSGNLYSTLSLGSIFLIGDNRNAVIYDSILLRYTDPSLPSTYSIDSSDKLATTWGKVKNQLYQNYPNPFNPETWISYQLAEDSEATISIYNSEGQLIRTLELGRVKAGRNQTHWDGKDEKGQTVASGVYFYVLKSKDGFTDTKKMVLIK